MYFVLQTTNSNQQQASSVPKLKHTTPRRNQHSSQPTGWWWVSKCCVEKCRGNIGGTGKRERWNLLIAQTKHTYVQNSSTKFVGRIRRPFSRIHHHTMVFAGGSWFYVHVSNATIANKQRNSIAMLRFCTGGAVLNADYPSKISHYSPRTIIMYSNADRAEIGLTKLRHYKTPHHQINVHFGEEEKRTNVFVCAVV